MSAVAHVLTLVSSLAGSIEEGGLFLARHPALGSLLRALCVRVPNTAVRRAACTVLYRASHWQALGRDADSMLSSGDDMRSTMARPVVGTNGEEGGNKGTPTSVKRHESLPRVLFNCLRADLARVQAVPFARRSRTEAGVRVGLSPTRRDRNSAALPAAAGRGNSDDDTRGSSSSNGNAGGGRDRDEPLVVPRLHLVEVTSLIAGLVHVMLEGEAMVATNNTAAAAAVVSSSTSVARANGVADAPEATARPPPLPLRPGDDGGSTRAEGIMSSVVVDGNGQAEYEDGSGSESAAEWLLEEAARRLAAHEFTETFK